MAYRETTRVTPAYQDGRRVDKLAIFRCERCRNCIVLPDGERLSAADKAAHSACRPMPIIFDDERDAAIRLALANAPDDEPRH